ncbi:hypothetical protein OK015_19380 [Mycobacterium sp. Aquia_216]|uniref:hypothetical protein n=1 Tax=Mycobacterium sp. Aquia_216 TaxID=2991729 RepID=UPI00227CE5FB|nr:hypothetical protein [Mycobacterium sp. Aquia_216]WAJ43361.1 hypothetical protein OK015_19380 [Mycobacterium sp. Aquia_216]
MTAPEATDQPANPRAAADLLGERHDAPAELAQAQHCGQTDPDVLFDAGADQQSVQIAERQAGIGDSALDGFGCQRGRRAAVDLAQLCHAQPDKRSGQRSSLIGGRYTDFSAM